jgi:1-acyl-sn-glycerol-3-phosphate acyltransferase
VVFPEGGIHHGSRSVLGGDPEIKEGAALIAVKAGVPMVPAIIDGARQTYVKQNWFFRRFTIRLTLGEPFRLPPNCKRDGAHAIIREKLLALAAEAGRTRRD